MRLVRALAALAALAAVCFSAIAQEQAGGGGDDLAARVAAEAARVQADPPVHEREEPWTVSVEELRKEAQPLRREQLEERIGVWLDLLQGEVRKRIRLDIATDQADDPKLKNALVEASNAQDQVVQAVVERTNALIALAEARGSDMLEAKRYIGNATGTPLNWTDPEVLLAQTRAWLTRPDGGIRVGTRILTFLVIVVAFWILSRALGGVVGSAVKRLPKTSSLLRDFLVGTVKRLTMVVGFVVALGALGVNIGPLVAAIGAAGLVIGLALQGTLSNFASGILILIYRPYDVGDFIDAGGVSGKVEAMNLVSTRVSTFDNQVLFVPNNQIWNGVIKNINGRSTRRVDMTFGIGYGDDMAKAEAIINDIIASHPKTLQDPAPTVKVHELADSSVNFIVRPWSKVEDYWDVYWDVTRQIKERFDAEGVGIPFPQRDLHLPEPIEVVVKNG